MSSVMQQLGEETDSPQALPVYRILIAALGFYPPGTCVDLDTGEVTLVTDIPLAPLEFSRPPRERRGRSQPAASGQGRRARLRQDSATIPPEASRAS